MFPSLSSMDKRESRSASMVGNESEYMAKKEGNPIVQDKMEDAGAQTPAKDDNTVLRHLGPPNFCQIF